MSRLGWLLAAIGSVVIAGVVGFLLFNMRDPGPTMVTADSTISGTTAVGQGAVETPGPGATTEFAPTDEGAEPATPEPATPEPSATPSNSSDIEDAWLQDALAVGRANPSQSLPGRDTIATELLNLQLRDAGHDLTGIDIVVYPDGPIPAIVLLSASDSVLVGMDDRTGGEDFLSDLIQSPVLADFDVESFVMRLSGADDVGPFVFTMQIGVSELQSSLDGDADVLELFAFQLERED